MSPMHIYLYIGGILSCFKIVMDSMVLVVLLFFSLFEKRRWYNFEKV
jgi:hypothetical protein